jgi:hypothetical protein
VKHQVFSLQWVKSEESGEQNFYDCISDVEILEQAQIEKLVVMLQEKVKEFRIC